MKSVSVLLFTAGLVSAVAVPVQLAERGALQPLPGVAAVEEDLEKRSLGFVELMARQEAAQSESPSSAAPAAASTTAAAEAPAETQNNQDQNKDQNQDQNQNKDQNKDQNQDQNKDQNKDNKGQNNNNNNKDNKNNNNNNKENNNNNNNNNKDNNNNNKDNNNNNKDNNNNNNNNNDQNNNNNNNGNRNDDINQIIQQGLQGNLFQNLLTPSITAIINQMGIGQNFNFGAISNLSFANQILVLNQLQLVQGFAQFGVVPRQQVIAVLNNGFVSNGLNVALFKRDVEE